ncbi:MAG: trypsin-like serine protease [Desulfobacterales bacterium]|nr:trypsin-like serine protease [Desulfobacterales bacterium]
MNARDARMMKMIIAMRKTGCFILAPALWIVLAAAGAWALTEDEKNNIEVYRSASRAVVNITTIVVTYDFFFDMNHQEGTGSGVIIDDDGYILTNNHVIKNAHRIEVTLSDGSKRQGRMVGADPDNDLAIIKIDADGKRLHALPFGDSDDLQIGQKVLAIGNPFGLAETLTTGIISSIGRSIRADNGMLIEGLIQTDAAINPGNSGGPLLDSRGEIIGVNTAIFSPTGASVGIGLAVPSDTARRVSRDLIEKGYVSYPWLGVSHFPLTPWLARALDLKVERGLMLIDVLRRGPAGKAGLRGSDRRVQVGNYILPIGGDVIVAIDGKEVDNSEILIRMIRKKRPGNKVTLKILRRGRFKKVTVVLGERPANR